MELSPYRNVFSKCIQDEGEAKQTIENRNLAPIVSLLVEV